MRAIILLQACIHKQRLHENASLCYNFYVSCRKSPASDKKGDRLGAFEILVEMATKAKDKLDQSSSDVEAKGLTEEMDMNDIQAAQSLQALRMLSGDNSEVGEMGRLQRRRRGDRGCVVGEDNVRIWSGGRRGCGRLQESPAGKKLQSSEFVAAL